MESVGDPARPKVDRLGDSANACQMSGMFWDRTFVGGRLTAPVFLSISISQSKQFPLSVQYSNDHKAE